jgi:hypothetical protein
MTTRRDFIKAAGASGIVFCGCAMRDVARSQGSDGQRLPVTVNGKRIKTIDVHAHCHFHEALALMGDEAGRVMPRVKGAKEHFIVIEERLKGMDAQAIDMEVLSINPFWYRKDRDTAAKIVELQNEKLAALSASRPDRFAAFASLALQYPDLAVRQLETAVKKQGLRGAAIGGSVLGEEFSDPKFHPACAPCRSRGPPCDTGNLWLARLNTTVKFRNTTRASRVLSRRFTFLRTALWGEKVRATSSPKAPRPVNKIAHRDSHVWLGSDLLPWLASRTCSTFRGRTNDQRPDARAQWRQRHRPQQRNTLAELIGHL